MAGDLTPSELEAISIASGSAAALAESAIGVITSLSERLGTMAFQDADNVDIDGGDIGDVTLSGTITVTATLNGGTYNAFTMTGSITNSGTISGGSISSVTLSSSTLSGNTVTGGTVDSDLSDDTNELIKSSTTLSDNSGAAAGTLANAPTVGDPTKWVAIDDNGTTRYIPTWT